MSYLDALSITGDIATPKSADWDRARQAWNLAADQHPAAVAYVEDAHDIAKVIRFAAAHNLRVTAQSTGHGAFSLGSLDGTILIKTERLRGVEVDPSARTARVEAGVLARELSNAAQEHSLSSMPGSSPDVGVAGFTLGGGLSWHGRRYGLACNRVIGIELVTADGEIKRVDTDSDPDLFWALRGGGGSFAIVTALHTSLLPISEVYAGTLIFPADLGADAVYAYRDWTATVPDTVTSIVRFLKPPPLPDVPEPLRDRRLLTIGAACIGSQAEGEEIFAPMRKLGEPIMDSFTQMPTNHLSKIHMDPEEPVPFVGHHVMLRDLPNDAIDTFVGAVGATSNSPLLLVELRQLGGALGRTAENAGALSKFDAGFAMYAAGLPLTPELAKANNDALDGLETAMKPWACDGAYMNFVERPRPIEAVLPADVCQRLAEVKERWDPQGIIRGKL